MTSCYQDGCNSPAVDGEVLCGAHKREFIARLKRESARVHPPYRDRQHKDYRTR